MQFQTLMPIHKSHHLIDYNSILVSLGSCFAENIGEKFDYYKFKIATNPFGIIFNPISIERIVARVVHQELFTEKDVFLHHNSWHCFEVHSEMSQDSKEQFLKNLNLTLQTLREQLLVATNIIITLGTSWVYRNVESKKIVANCYQLPQHNFTKELLSAENSKQSLESIILMIKSVNKEAKFIFTVSPVRHIKDGFIENNVSKANLITAVYSLVFQSPDCVYFPSYEILMDELRDYRFYKKDMLHPSQVAIDYIWERFCTTQIAASIYPVMKQVDAIQKALAHKTFNPNSENHQQFLVQLKLKMAKLVTENPNLKF
jgi:GSCFA family